MTNKCVIVIVTCILTFSLLICSFMLGCGNGGEKTTTTTTTTTPPDLADLKIAGFDVMQIEGQPIKAGQEFALNVIVMNIGSKSSGTYNVKLHIEEVSSGSIYPIGTFLKDPMHPGEQYAVYSSVNRMVNNPGIHRVVAEIVPLGWEDANLSNNTTNYDFNVVP